MSAPPPVDIIGPDHVQVPVDLPPVSDTALALWVTYVWRAGDKPTCWPGQERIQADLGRPGADPSHLRTLNAELETAGMLRVARQRLGDKTRNTYRPLLRARLEDGRRFVKVPASLLVALAAGRVGPEHVAAAVRWMRDCRERGGWTDDSLTVVAARWGQSLSTVRRHRSLLVALGVIEERRQRGAATLTGLPGRLPPLPPALFDLPEPRSRATGHPAHERLVAPVAGHGQNYPDVNYPDVNYRPSSPSGEEVTARTAPACASAAPPRRQEDGMAVVAQLPRPWRDCEPWVLRRLAGRVGRAMADRYGAAAVVAAVARYAPDPAQVADGRPNPPEVRHLPALGRVLALLAADVKAGACPDCGAEHDAAQLPAGDGGWLVVLAPGVCLLCNEPGAAARPTMPLPGSFACDDCWAAAQDPAAA